MERQDTRTTRFSLPVVAVSCYLVAAGLWLIVTRQVPAPGIPKMLSSLFRRRYRSPLAHIAPERDHCWLAPLPKHLPSDAESGSKLVLFEDDSPLGPAHAPHEEIRRLGAGRFSHWGAQLYFSTSDNTDPRRNGRRYRVEEL